jgi:transposase InsO family protein
MQRFGCSECNALRIVRMSASTYRYTSTKRDESVLKLRIKEITKTRVHYGYRRVHVLLRREGHRDNVKRVSGCTARKGCAAAEAPWRIKAAKIDFSRPGKPTDNARRKLQREAAPRVPERALVPDARRCEGQIAAWRVDDN